MHKTEVRILKNMALLVLLLPKEIEARWQRLFLLF